MKFYSRANQYKASNVYYDVKSEQAFSYNWRCFVKRIEGKLVFNYNNYSRSTCKHLHKVGALLRELGLTIDIEVSTREGLQNINSLSELKPLLNKALLEAENKEKRSRKYKEIYQRDIILINQYLNIVGC